MEQLPGLLTAWYRQHARELPWRRDREPYHVWLSEIMLQQTRVEAVRGYYTRFLAEIPTIAALAAASPDQLNKLWEGLGYYTRVRNLQKAAQVVMERHGGVFPGTMDEIRALPGIGPYTAGAIGSICFGLPEPAVDGNVLRVMTRLLDDSAPIDQPATKKRLTALLRDIYPHDDPGTFTQSLMELGATVCVPNGAPLCGQCPVRTLCRARAAGHPTALPVKAGRKPRRIEEKTVFYLTCSGRLAVRRRPEQGLLAGLWELPNVPGHLPPQEAVRQAEAWGLHPEQLEKQLTRTHIFTHVEWRMICYVIRCGATPDAFIWADAAALQQAIALPTAFRMFTKEEGL